jgi:hypothetical protein
LIHCSIIEICRYWWKKTMKPNGKRTQNGQDSNKHASTTKLYLISKDAIIWERKYSMQWKFDSQDSIVHLKPFWHKLHMQLIHYVQHGERMCWSWQYKHKRILFEINLDYFLLPVISRKCASDYSNDWLPFLVWLPIIDIISPVGN